MRAKELTRRSTKDLELQVKAAKRLLALDEAKNHLLPFARFMMPDLEDPDDADKSQYSVQPHHRLLAEALEKVERGECLRLAISIPPQFGKSLIASRLFPAWYVGRKPDRKVIFATYSQDFAQEFGGDVRTFMLSQSYKAVFPKVELKTGSKAKDLLSTTAGGRLAFIGRGSAGTGKSADLVIIDDPLKNAEEAESPTIRRQLHDWFSKVIYTRARVTTAIVVIQTRWHEDDLIGKLCDPDHPDHDPTLAREWTYINVPAVVSDPALADALDMTLDVPTEPSVTEAFGNKPMSSLWPAQFSLKHLASAHRLNRLTFNALYMGRPSPEDGEYFRKDWMLEYSPEQLPKNLRYYGASDHAAGDKQQNDPTVIGCVGVDRDDNIWILPDVVWEKMETDRTVEELLHQMKTHKPLLWWMESELISKSFGPFLRKRMIETKTYCTIDPQTPSKDKRLRARAIQGRMSMQKLRFPKWVPWWRDAQSQLLKFPFGTNDDFVDWLSWIGLGLTKEIAATNVTENRNVVRVGSFAWVKAESRQRERAEALKKLSAGW